MIGLVFGGLFWIVGAGEGAGAQRSVSVYSDIPHVIEPEGVFRDEHYNSSDAIESIGKYTLDFGEEVTL